MCCRYYMGDYDPEESLAQYYAQAQRRADTLGVAMVSSGEVRPTDIAPVIAPDAKNREPGAFPMKWGFTHPARNVLIFNIRAETAAEKPFFAASTGTRRCLIPAEHYFEWKKDGREKIKYAIRPRDGQLYMAGLYFRLPGERLPCFSILTVEASGGLETVHRRMPLMVEPGNIEQWLCSGEAFDKLVKAQPPAADYRPV